MNKDVRCSRCEGVEDLHLVTIRYSEESPSGRILVYCMRCRTDYKDCLGVSIPLGKVTRDSFMDLYRTGKSESDPEIAASIVFGTADPELVMQARQFILGA